MDRTVFEELVNNKIITDVEFVASYSEDDEKLKSLTFENLSQVSTTSEFKKYDILDFSTGGDFVLDSDLIIVSPIEITENTTIDLNGYSIINRIGFIDNSDGTSNCYVFWVKSGNLIIKGKGKVAAVAGSEYDIAVWAAGGNVDIYGGHFESRGQYSNGSDCIYSSKGSKVRIFGGEFECANKSISYTPPQYSVLNEKGKSDGVIEVYGGMFHDFDPSNNSSENPKKDFCADGFKSVYIGDNLYEVIKA